MTRTARSSILALAFLFSAGGAGAENADQSKDHNKNGWYVGINGIYAEDFYQNDVEKMLSQPFILDLKGSGGLNARVGYRVTSWFAAEVLYEWVVGFKADGALGTVEVDRVFQHKTHSPLANFKFLYPEWPVQPYIGIGLGAQWSEIVVFGAANGKDTTWSFLGRPSFGVDWIVTDNIVLNLELAGSLPADKYDGVANSPDLFYLTFGGGIQYRF